MKSRLRRGPLKRAKRFIFGLQWWQQLLIAAITPLLVINGSVAFFGSTVVFPLSPFFLIEKLSALRQYATHRPTCLLFGHDDLAPLIRAAEKRHKLPRGLMQAIVEVESNAQPHRISSAGAMGPAQLMPATAAYLSVDDAFDPVQAIDGGAKYLAQLLERTDHDVRLAVASYNAGPGAVHGSVPRNGQTEFYVAAVMSRFNARAQERPKPKP